MGPSLLLQQLPRCHFDRLSGFRPTGRGRIAAIAVATAAVASGVGDCTGVGIVVVAAVIVLVVQNASIVVVKLALVSGQCPREHLSIGVRTVDDDHGVVSTHRGVNGYLAGLTCVIGWVERVG